MENASPPSSGNTISNFLYGMVYKQPKKAAKNEAVETSTAKEYNWTGFLSLLLDQP